MSGILNVTIDSGFLIGLERRKYKAVTLMNAALKRSLRLTVPVAVVAEWWRGTPQHKQSSR